jgi:hypothetical protein
MSTPLTLSRHKLSVEDYHQMGRAGILGEDSRVELVAGELIDMAPIGSLHASVVRSNCPRTRDMELQKYGSLISRAGP